MDKDATARFLGAFTEVERYLATRHGTGARREEFSTLLARAERSDRAIRPYADDLKGYADLRNLLVHRRLRGRYLAAVDEEVAGHLEGIVRTLTQGKDVYSVFRREVTVAEADAPVGDALTVMSRDGLSQLPVYRNRVFVDLLTADTVSRWLGANAQGELVDLTVPVGEVLPHKESIEKYAFVRRSESLLGVIEAFDEHTRRGERLSAVLITQHGRATENLLGIVTAYDLPQAFEAAGG